MKRSLLLYLLMVYQPLFAACPPGILTCSNANQIPSDDKTNAEKQDFLVLKSGQFALERAAAGENKVDLRPSWQLDNNTRLSLKASKRKVELRVRIQW